MPNHNVIYESKFIQIRFNQQKDFFEQTWLSGQNITVPDFKVEMLNYTKLYSVHRPKYSLWDHLNFKLTIGPEEHDWIEKNVNVPCKEYGNEKCAFVVGEDVISHLAVMDSFEKQVSCVVPRHFGKKEDALKWFEDEVPQLNQKNIAVKFNGTDEKGQHEFILKTVDSTIEHTLKNIQTILNTNQFIKENSQYFFSLTNKEKQIFNLYRNGKTVKEIASELFISELTVRTHWRNVKKKLKIQSSAVLQSYFAAFNF